MFQTLRWTAYRMFRKKEPYTLFAALAVASLILMNVASINPDMDLSTLNIAYGTNFSTKEAFLAWYRLWLYQWIVSATEPYALFAIAASIFPDADAPEWKVPVISGHPRWHMVLSIMVCYLLEIVLLSLLCILLGMIFKIQFWALEAPISYYVRTLVLKLYLSLGFGSLALSLVLMFRKRIVGIITAFILMLLLLSFRNAGLFSGTILRELLPRNAQKVDAWMWQVTIHATPERIAIVLLFPILMIFLATGIGLWRFRRRDLC